MLTRKIELWVGLFILSGFTAFLILVFNIADIDIKPNQSHYTLHARFTNIGELKVRSPIKVAGVVIGQVTDIELDPKELDAVVELNISNQYNQFSENSSLAILTSGLLGAQFLELTPGFVTDDTSILKDGDNIDDTHSALILEDLIGQFLYQNKSKGS